MRGNLYPGGDHGHCRGATSLPPAVNRWPAVTIHFFLPPPPSIGDDRLPVRDRRPSRGSLSLLMDSIRFVISLIIVDCLAAVAIYKGVFALLDRLAANHWVSQHLFTLRSESHQGHK